MTYTTMQKPVLVTGPATTPVSLSEAKAHCRVDTSDDDAVITQLISAATSHLDGYTGTLGRCLITQTWRFDCSGFPGGDRINLPLSPMQSVASVTYKDGNGDTQTLSTGAYHVSEDASGSYVLLDDTASWPTTDEQPDAVSVTAVFGYGDASTDIPDAIKSALLLLIGHWFEHREAVTMGVSPSELPMAVKSLLAPFRAVGV